MKLKICGAILQTERGHHRRTASCTNTTSCDHHHHHYHTIAHIHELTLPPSHTHTHTHTITHRHTITHTITPSHTPSHHHTHLGDEEQKHGLAKMPENSHNRKRHPCKIAERVADKHSRRIPGPTRELGAQKAPTTNQLCLSRASVTPRNGTIKYTLNMCRSALAPSASVIQHRQRAPMRLHPRTVQLHAIVQQNRRANHKRLPGLNAVDSCFSHRTMSMRCRPKAALHAPERMLMALVQNTASMLM
jgi:hypothetical protein